MKKRYQVEKTGFKNWVRVVDLKGERTTPWMHTTDFGITHKHLPKYCAVDARALFQSPIKEKS